MARVNKHFWVLRPSSAIVVNGTEVGNAAVLPDSWESVLLTFSLKVSQTLHAGATADVYVRYSPDQGTTWDDLVHFAQVGNAAYTAQVVSMLLGSSIGVSRSVRDKTLPAGSVALDVSWCDYLRVEVVTANLNGTTDTVTVEVDVYAQ